MKIEEIRATIISAALFALADSRSYLCKQMLGNHILAVAKATCHATSRELDGFFTIPPGTDVLETIALKDALGEFIRWRNWLENPDQLRAEVAALPLAA